MLESPNINSNPFQISPENDLPNLVCDYCHNLVLQFYGYFETVNANQDELRKVAANVQKEEVFAVPLEQATDMCPLEMEVDSEEDDVPLDSLVEVPKSPEVVEPPPIPPESLELPDRPSETFITKTDQNLTKVYTKQQLLTLSYTELTNLPLNFTCSLLCPLCPEPNKFQVKSLVQKHIFMVHMKDASPSQKLRKTALYTRSLESQCNLCHSRSLKEGRQGYQDHKFVHYNIKPYKCAICPFVIHTKQNLRHHIGRHVDRVKRRGCLYCTRNFSSEFYRNQHIRQSHLEKLVECLLCGQKLIGSKVAKDHLRKHEEEEKTLTIECNRCMGGIRFPDVRVLKMHKNQHAREDKSRKKLACHLCERKFHKENALKVHLEYHRAGKISACLICGKSETNFTNRKLSKHAQDHLRQKFTYKCDKCDLEFRNRVYLVNHKRSVHERNDQTCDRCGKLVVGYMMKRHLQQCKAGDLPCTHCSKVFKKESERRKHNREVHVGIRCFRCNKQFERISLLALHQKYDPEHNKGKKTVNRKKDQTKDLVTFK